VPVAAQTNYAYKEDGVEEGNEEGSKQMGGSIKSRSGGWMRVALLGKGPRGICAADDIGDACASKEVRSGTISPSNTIFQAAAFGPSWAGRMDLSA